MGGYDDVTIPTNNVTINKKLAIYLIIGITIIIIGMVTMPLLPKSLEDRIKTLYDEAQDHIDNGNLEEARIIYSEIIELKPNEEKAWHEKGKILVRTKTCDSALNHYEAYVKNFPDSSRGMEGFELAKLCNS
ncbi:MAG: tetratricopeptide repeat protein [Nitrosopumilus sp.]